MILKSSYTDLGPIILPSWQGRQKYMHTFNPQDPVMADGYSDYLDVVSILCKSAKVESLEAHMTVDEKIVKAGMSQRRPGPHVDGCFMPELQAWGHPGGTWAHYCNNLPMSRMSIIVASSVAGCMVYEGNFVGQPANDGDMSHIQDQLGVGKLLLEHRGFLLSSDCVHESMRFDNPTMRTFLRIAFHN